MLEETASGASLVDGLPPKVAGELGNRLAQKIFGTKVCGLRSYSGNELDCTCTMILCPGRKT